MTKISRYFMAGLLILSTLGIFGCGGGGSNTGGGTDLPPLSITSTAPAGGAAGVAVNAQITVTFTSDVNAATLNSSTFTLSGPEGPIGGSVSYDAGSKTATFTPYRSLPPLTQYAATITTGVRSTAGSALSSPYSWLFTTVSGFWAYNFATDSYYFVNAIKVGEGQHCHVYIDQNASGAVDQTTIDSIITEFDTAIYPGDTNAFGSEPNPGIDADPKIYLLLLNIKDGFNAASNTTYVEGYFDPSNEYTQDQNSHTNLKEMFFMDTYPATPGSTSYYATLAHEFQHMIHWEQKTNLQGLNDDTWLDEGMSTVARTYCGLGTDTDDSNTVSYLSAYASDPSHSLTAWDSTVESYGAVYMWSQYFKDRWDPLSGAHTIFWRMIHNNRTGIASVNVALTDIGSGKDFTGTFRDWTIANAFGNTPPSGHPEWSYTSLAGWTGLYSDAPDSITWNVQTLSPLPAWSAGYYAYTPNPDGAITWNRPIGSIDTATLIDTGGTTNAASWTVTDLLISGTTYSYTNDGYLIDQNPSGSSGGGAGVTNNAVAVTPRQMLAAADRNTVLLDRYRRTGRPAHICVDAYFREKEREMRAKGARPPFGPQTER